MRVETDPGTVLEALAGEREDERPVADYYSMFPEFALTHFRAEQQSALLHAFLRLRFLGPPSIREMIKFVVGPRGCKRGARRSDVAGEVETFAYPRVDFDRQT